MPDAASAVWAILVPLGGATAAFLWPRAAHRITAAVALATSAAVAALVAQVWRGGAQDHAVGGWAAPLGIQLHVDGLSAVLLLATALTGLAVTAYALGYFRAPAVGTGMRRWFCPLWLLLWAALNALFVSADLFNLYVTLELMGLAAVALVALAGGAAFAGAARYLFVSLTASLTYLLGVALLYGAYGTLSLDLLAQRIAPGAIPWAAFGLMAGGLLLKTALFPLHFWLPSAHASAPAPVSALLSGLVVKASFYLLLRIWLSWGDLLPAGPGVLLGSLGAAAVIWGSLQALRQRRLKTMLAYSTVAQLGYLFLPFALSRDVAPLAWSGAIYCALSHALAKAAMFLAAGNIRRAGGHDRIDDLDEIVHHQPGSLFAFALAGLSLAGVPPGGGFVGKWLLLEAAVRDGQWWCVAVIVAGGLLAATYVFRVVGRAFTPSRGRQPHLRLPRVMDVAAVALALFSIALGLLAPRILDLLAVATPFHVPGASWGGFGASPWLPLLVVASPLVPGIVVFTLPERAHRLRIAVNLAGIATMLALVLLMLLGVARGESFEARLPLLPGVDLALGADALAMLFVTLSAVLWFATTVYAIGYLEGSPHRSRFFGFFNLCVASTVGLALARNLLTFLVFYEVLTLVTYPLVVHRGTEEARRAGRTYLIYTLAGGALLFLGAVWLHALAGTLEFSPGGFVAALPPGDHAALVLVFVLLAAGLGVKAALVPLHGWLPVAMIAPAPVSALLHAVAVVKAGAFGLVRLVLDVYGIDFADQLGVARALAIVAAITIVYGSLRALFQDNLKRRLAFSTVSQISYVVLGVAIAGPVAVAGGLVHLVHQGVMKITLFFCAGNLSETLGVKRVSGMAGVGRRMPWTMSAFTLAAFGMIGVPPLAGFFSKWYLASGALAAGEWWVIGVLLLSSVLNAAYFLPILYVAWFKKPARPWPVRTRAEAVLPLLLPPVATALLTLGVGLFANAPFSPLTWARLIVERGYLP